MLHAPMFGKSRRTASSDGFTPFTPARYLSCRRQAAGLTIEQTGELLANKRMNARDVRALVRLLETPGVTARTLTPIEFLGRAFPIDAAVYLQLSTERPDRHPQLCRACASTPGDAAPDHSGNFAWDEPSICAACRSKGLS